MVFHIYSWDKNFFWKTGKNSAKSEKKFKNLSLYNMTQNSNSIWENFPAHKKVEVIIPEAIFERIIKISSRNNMNLSWVIRFCTIRLLRSPALNQIETNPESKFADAWLESAGMQGRRNAHSHRTHFCLYGNDLHTLKIAAYQMQCAYSRIVRMALLMFLPVLEARSIPVKKKTHRFYAGIKLIADVEIHIRAWGDRQISLLQFPKADYW